MMRRILKRSIKARNQEQKVGNDDEKNKEVTISDDEGKNCIADRVRKRAKKN
jgi:hypothetical protein